MRDLFERRLLGGAPEALVIERMLPEDVPAVMAVDRLCFPTPWSENAYRSELGNVNAFYLVARQPEGMAPSGEIEGRIIGFAGAWIVMDEAHVTTLGIHPECRRQGIGERLLAALLEEARARGVRRATLEVRESNRGAQALYARFGFEPIARRRRYYSDTDEDAIVMWVEGLQSGVQVFRCSGVRAFGPDGFEHEQEHENDLNTRTPEHLNT